MSRARGVPLLLAPSYAALFALTFIFGPIGLLVFMAVRYFWMTPPQRA